MTWIDPVRRIRLRNILLDGSAWINLSSNNRAAVAENPCVLFDFKVSQRAWTSPLTD